MNLFTNIKPKNYYIDEINKIYKPCSSSCDECNPPTKDYSMNCINCINNYLDMGNNKYMRCHLIA